ncbi:hypothetical protein [Corynebacterium sp. Marseille-P4321]|uniref:hypothetical protein n=1 Tax=Corynebacterium sp. Marseille-P4321 TaxID=2736603 RepID=UPI001F60C625|nr:hypothetical protein [Corynebacterium sp. Marseille-P4321]
MRYKRGMRILCFVVAGIFSLVAVYFAYVETAAPDWVGGVAIVVAGLFLVLGFYEQYKRQEEPSLELDAEERETIKRMKKEGDFQLAVKQVQMWKRHASAEDAARIVRDV